MPLLGKFFDSTTSDAGRGHSTASVANATAPVDQTESVVAECERQTASGHFAASLSAIDMVLSSRPHDPELLLARVSTLLAWGRFREARAVLRRVDLSRAAPPAHCAKLGASLLNIGDLPEAESWMRKAVAADPDSSEYRAGLAAVLHRQDRIDEAAAVYAEVLALQPADFDASMGLGSCELDRRDPVAAERQFRKALAIDSTRAVAWSYLGAALDRQDRGPEGLAAHEQAVHLEQLQGEDVDAYLGLASSLRDAARFADALALLESNLQRRQSAQAQTLYAQMLLAIGRLPEGWRHNEFRWLTEHFLARRPRYAKPMWDGEDIVGKTILLRAEQGMGDTIQFARYALMVKKLGANVHLAVPPELLNLAHGMRGIDRVFALGQEEAASAFDYYAPLLSLPRVFGTRLDTIPADIPYIVADRDRLAHWATRLGSDQGLLKVGLVWGGNPVNLEDRYRSLPLQMLAPLGAIAGVRFYSLQKGSREHEAGAPPPGLDLVNLGPELVDFADTAAAIMQMDLVISVCTSVAHLTGALGKPLWVMLHRAADWRWLTEREDSPWYPTARLFRQTRRGEWVDVIDAVKSALEVRLRNGASGIVAKSQPIAGLPPRLATKPTEVPGYQPGFSAVAQTRVGILEYFPDDCGAGDSLGWYGEWLQPQLDFLAALIRPGATVTEVGAGVGAHAPFLGGLVGDAGHLLVYEWRPRLARVLRQNLVAKRIAPVTIMRRKLGRPAPGGSARMASDASTGGPNSPATNIPVNETLDELRLERLDWLKINEGICAPDVLAGAADTLWRLRPALFLSATDDAALRELAGIAMEYGYRCWRHECALFNPANFNRRADDIFGGRTALALLAIPEEIDVDIAHPDCVELK